MAKQRPLNHQQTERLLASYRDLSIQEKSAVDAHLATCQQCSAFAESSQQMDSLLKRTAWKQPDPRLAENFYNTIEKDGRSWFQTLSRLSGQLAGIAVLLVVVFSAWLIIRSGPVQTPIESPTVTAVETAIQTPVPTDIPNPGVPLNPLYTISQTVSLYALSPQGSYLATVHNEKDISIWAAATGDWLHRIKVDTAPLDSLAFTPNGVNLIGQDTEGQFHRWLAFNGSYQRTFEGPQAPLGTPFALGNTTLVIVTAENNLEFWPLVGSEPNYWIELSGLPVIDVAISADGQSIAAVFQDGSVAQWNDYDGKMEAIPNTSENSNGIAFTHDGRQFVTYQEDTLQIWQENNLQHQLTSEFRSIYGQINDIQFASENKYLMVSFIGGFLEMWDMNTGQSVATFHTRPAEQTAIGLTRNAFIYLTLDTQNIIKIWEKPEEK